MESKKYCILIPSLGVPEILVPTLFSVCSTVEPEEVCICVSIDEISDTNIPMVIAQISSLIQVFDIKIIKNKRKQGFASNVNNALEFVRESEHGMYIILNDDVRATRGWCDRLYNAMGTETISHGDIEISIEDYGVIGIVGPVSDNVSGLQQIQIPQADIKENQFHLDGIEIMEAFSDALVKQREGKVVCTDFLSGFCMAISPACMEELLYTNEDGDIELFDQRFGIGGFEDDDLCVRAIDKGWCLAIASDCFIHHLCHQSIDKYYPEQEKGLTNYIHYIEKYKKPIGYSPKIIAAYRVKFDSFFEFIVCKRSLKNISERVDGIAFVMTKNIQDLVKENGFNLFYESLEHEDKEFLDSCANSENDSDFLDSLRSWVKSNCAITDGSSPFESMSVFRDHEFKVECEVYKDSWNEKSQRNMAISLAEELGADWVLAVDADELLEDRADYKMLKRLCSHPNPCVRAYNLSVVNHWENENLVRVDEPWGDNGKLTHHQSSTSLWKVLSKPRKIIGGGSCGFGCGKSPVFPGKSTRIANIRFRHYGYVVQSERYRKYVFYSEVTESSDFQYIMMDQNIKMQAYSRSNGLILSMLAYEKEKPHMLWEKLDTMYGLYDSLAFVWTGCKEKPQWADDMSEHYGFEWLHEYYTDNLSDCRNAGVREAYSRAQGGKGSWILVLDPDEVSENLEKDLMCIRRLVEANDISSFVFNFANVLQSGHVSFSEAIRMFRLTGPVVEFRGRIHESVETSVVELRKKGLILKGGAAPIQLINTGMLVGEEELQAKIQRYTDSLIEGLKEKDNPRKAAIMTCLALQCNNDGRSDDAYRLLKEAADMGNSGFMAYKELSLHHLREAKKYLGRAVNSLPRWHHTYGHASNIYKFLCENVVEQPLVGTLPIEMDFSFLDDQ